jgi:hypothetical protein
MIGPEALTGTPTEGRRPERSKAAVIAAVLSGPKTPVTVTGPVTTASGAIVLGRLRKIAVILAIVAGLLREVIALSELRQIRRGVLISGAVIRGPNMGERAVTAMLGIAGHLPLIVMTARRAAPGRWTMTR